jgi:hypothetical protein
MTKYTQLKDISPRNKLIMGLCIAGVGLLTAWLVTSYPVRLRAPMWVAMAACFCFVMAGMAVALHAFVSRRAYNWLMVVLMVAMTSIPTWIAFDFGFGTMTK